MKVVMGTCYYTHRQNSEDIGLFCRWNKKIKEILNETDFDFTIVKYDEFNEKLSLIQSPDWDTAKEPIVGDSLVYDLNNGTVKFIKSRSKNKQIYHSKELFVSSDYKGFDIKEAKRRTEEWNKIPNLDKRRIGNQNFWFATLDANGLER